MEVAWAKILFVEMMRNEGGLLMDHKGWNEIKDHSCLMSAVREVVVPSNILRKT